MIAPHTITHRIATLLAVCLTAVLFAGCAGYRLGPTNGMPAQSRSVQVNFFENKTYEPRLSEYVNSSLRKKLQQDGTYRLETGKDEGDVIVTGTIIDYQRSAVAYQPSDIITVRDYVVFIIVQARAHERLTGKVLFDRTFSGRTTIRVGNDMASAERQAAPLLADDLAQKISGALVDGTW